MIWRRSQDNLPVCGHVLIACIIWVFTLFVCAGCSSLRQVFTKEIASKSMSLEVRDSFFIPYHLLSPYSLPINESNSMCLGNLTTARATSFSDGHIVPIVRHLSVNQVAKVQRSDTTYKASGVSMQGSSVLPAFSIEVIGWFVFLVVCVTVSLVLIRRKP